MRKREADRVLSDFSDEEIDEMAGQGTKTATERWVYKMEIVKDRILERKQEIFLQLQEIEEGKKVLMERFNFLAKEYEEIDNDIMMTVRGKRKDIEDRKTKEEIEKGIKSGIEVG
jgi:hypothetical protein